MFHICTFQKLIIDGFIQPQKKHLLLSIISGDISIWVFNILLIFAGHYDARMRFLIKRLAWNLRVKWEEVEHLELSVVENLSTNQYLMSE